MKTFLARKCSEIAFHALAVFHPLSNGNTYHGCIILESLLTHCPKPFLSKLVTDKDLQCYVFRPNNKTHTFCFSSLSMHNISLFFMYAYSERGTVLTKNALFRNLHQGNINSFFIGLICFRPSTKGPNLQPVKVCLPFLQHQGFSRISLCFKKLLKMFREWRFLDYLLEVSLSPKHGDEIATKYATFFIDLVARSACIEEGRLLFHGYEHLIVDSMIHALLDVDQSRTLWHRLMCGQTLVQFLDICSRPSIIDPASFADMAALGPPEPSPNQLFQMFNKSLKRLHTYIPQLCQAILFPQKQLEPIPLAGGIIQKPFGQIRLNCLELLTLSADMAQFKCGKVLAYLKPDFWKGILELAFVHKTNNLFLCHFRRLLHLSMIFRRRFLKLLFVTCGMLDSFIDFYNNDLPRSSYYLYVHTYTFSV
ncbi:hypothetical protein RFI_06921 [Reticulomyxa filosa]|uniref:Uncharacterized protein n=1 Tax=Reticulomyxa filosa TaxID=46433 RepID=X6NV59_RETFI|nr:hypothetical protein RFI_06921 [Reticulomyxa filosa]|eukprot:ETO30200.1 hypothetical protein RFI_06921 [Reticulomyxa filosa]